MGKGESGRRTLDGLRSGFDTRTVPFPTFPFSHFSLSFMIFCLLAFTLSAASPDPQTVVARVGREAIFAREVTRLVDRAAPGGKFAPDALPPLQAQALAELVNRRLVLAYAQRSGESPSDEEVSNETAALLAKLQRQGKSVSDFLLSQSATERELRRQIAWNLLWPRYLARYLTTARVEAYFAAHRRELDGSQVSVSHILLRLGSEKGSRTVAELTARAADIRQEIMSGKMSFAEAARKCSAGPSAKDDGRLGFIPRRGVMDEAFSRAAFALEAGQVSEPVKTPFGVHLIRCDQIRPGAKKLDDVRREVEEALGRELLEKLAQLERQHTTVEYTGKLPYFKPGTRELVAP